MRNNKSLFLLVLACLSLFCGGCIYSGRSISCYLNGKVERDVGLRTMGDVVQIQVHITQNNTCIYPPEFLIIRDVFGTCDDIIMLWEPILRLPTLPFELLYDAWAEDGHMIRLTGKTKLELGITKSLRFENHSESNSAVALLADGRTVPLPFLVASTSRETDSAPHKPYAKFMFYDTEGWMWFSSHVGSLKFWFWYKTRYNVPNDMLLFKVSSSTGEVKPVIIRDRFDSVYLSPEQTDFVVINTEREWWFVRGLGRIFFQSHL